MIGRQHAVAKEAHIAGSGCYVLIGGGSARAWEQRRVNTIFFQSGS